MRTKKKLIAIAMCVFCFGIILNCTHEDQDLNPPVTPPVVPAVSDKELVSQKVTAAPVIDGVIDAIWDGRPKLQFSTAVPDVTGDVFRGYMGNIIPSVTLRSVYDDNNIYFLAEWQDPTESLLRQPWYFDPATKTWAQESGSPTFSTSGSITRSAFYEDKIAMLWNVNNSVFEWNNATCYKSCHTGLPASDGSSRHYTNFPTEKIDMWHWKAVRGGVNGGFQFDDQYQDNTYPNGRKSDAGNSAYADNVQTLNNGVGNVKVPKYVIPGRSNYNWVLGTEITDGTAKLITGVDIDGVLTYSGGSIDPNTDAGYHRNGATVGAKAIPGITITTFTGSRGDISCKSTFTSSGWVLEFKRALKTTDTENRDVDFTSLSDQYFGFAIFENAQIAHSIKPNLILKFQK